MVSPWPDRHAPLLVYCHGMSGGPESFSRFWPQVNALPCHVIAPAGPYPHEVRSQNSITIGHAWYLYDGGPGLFAKTTRKSVEWLSSLIQKVEEDSSLVPRYRGLLGYSQGAYFSYAAALNRQDLFSHLVVASGNLKQDLVKSALNTPGSLRSLILHGSGDRTTPVRFARESKDVLMLAGYPVDLQILTGGHRLRPDRDQAAEAWLKQQWGV